MSNAIADLSSEDLASLWFDTQDDALEAMKAANVLGFGIVVRNCWHPAPDGDDEEQMQWHVSVLRDVPHEEDG
jgi:hypothetical protein